MALRFVVLLVIIGLAQCKHSAVRGRTQFEAASSGKWEDTPAAKCRKNEVSGFLPFQIWDEELAAKAAWWASQYPSGHNPDKTVESGKFTTGENLYWYMTTDGSYKLNVDKALESWFQEHKDYTYGAIQASDFTTSTQIGHYTQMLWSDSTHVGCAVSKHHDGYWNKFTVVCNYGPAGNWIGQEPYRSGHGAGKLVCGAGDCRKQYGDNC